MRILDCLRHFRLEDGSSEDDETGHESEVDDAYVDTELTAGDVELATGFHVEMNDEGGDEDSAEAQAETFSLTADNLSKTLKKAMEDVVESLGEESQGKAHFDHWPSMN